MVILGTMTIGGETAPISDGGVDPWQLTVERQSTGGVRVRVRYRYGRYAPDGCEFDVYSADVTVALALAGREIASRARA
jgi:hypothetical protein